jgi:hypothetical protein
MSSWTARVDPDAMMIGVTLLLSRPDLEQLLDTGACMEALRQGFLAVPSGTYGAPGSARQSSET